MCIFNLLGFIYISKWVGPRRDLHFFRIYFSFCSYIRGCFQLVTFAREHIWQKAFSHTVAGPSCPTNGLSKLIDISLQPSRNNIKRYIRDSIDFLNSIPEKIDPNTLIVTFDVTNLWMSILHELGKQAIAYYTQDLTKNYHSGYRNNP